MLVPRRLAAIRASTSVRSGALPQRAGEAVRRVAQQPHRGQRHDVGGNRFAGDQGHLAEGGAGAHARQRQVHAVLAGQPHFDRALEDGPERHAGLAAAHEHLAGRGGDLDALALQKATTSGVSATAPRRSARPTSVYFPVWTMVQFSRSSGSTSALD